MTAPHPVLVHLAAGAVAPGTVDDEAELLGSALEHRMVAPLLAAHLDGRVAISADGATTLGVWDLEERRLHLRFWRTIAEVQDRLAPLGAEVVVLKGVATEARWYDGLGERASTDVDVLVSPTAVDRAADVVAALDPDHGSLDAIDRLARRRRLQHVDLALGPVQLDLHFDPFKIGVPVRGLGAVWSATEALETEHGAIRVLRPEHELVLLLLHLNKDRFAHLGPFLDIGRIVERSVLDWDLVDRFVHDEGLDVPVWKSLDAVASVLALDVEVRPVTGPRARSWERWWGAPARLGGHEGRDRARTVQRWLPLHVRRRPVEVARELRRQLLPHRDLLEVAGRVGPGDGYLAGLGAALARRARAVRSR